MVNGLPTAVSSAPNPATVIHTLPAAVQSGEALLDVVDLWVQNGDDTDPARVNVAFTPAGGVPIVITLNVPAMTSLQVLSEEPFGGPLSGLGGGTISLNLDAGVGFSDSLTAWGWFVRTGG